MTDADILVFGCAVSFIALAGMYVFLREHVVGGEARPARVEPNQAAQEARRVA